MDYSKYITAANTKKGYWDTKITALRVEVDQEGADSSSSSSSSASSNTSSLPRSSSTNRLDALGEDDVLLDADDLDYGSIIKATKSRASNISNQLRATREESAGNTASTTTSGASTDTKVLEEGKATLEDIKLRNEDPIEGFYQDILGRDSDPEGKKDWQQKFDEGMSLTDIQEQFLRSDEYKKLGASTDTKVLDEGFYRDILARLSP